MKIFDTVNAFPSQTIQLIFHIHLIHVIYAIPAIHDIRVVHDLHPIQYDSLLFFFMVVC